MKKIILLVIVFLCLFFCVNASAKDIEIYSYINNMLKTINSQMYMPTRQQLLAIDSVFRQFEREYCGKKTAKGNELIKEEYTKRLKIDKIY